MYRVGLALLITISCLFPAPQSFAAQWETEVEIDPFTDAKQAFAGVAATVDGHPAYLVLRCFDSQLEVAVNFGPTKVTAAEVRYRIGKGEARHGTWVDSTTETAIFHPSPREFLSDLLGAEPKKLAIGVLGLDGLQVTSVFDISGIDGAAKVVREGGARGL